MELFPVETGKVVMVVLEQLVFGPSVSGDVGREVLGHSPGISRECARELVRLCESWGAVPPEGIRRPVMMSFPLESRLSALPGPLYAVIRVAQGLKPIFHAVVLGRSEYVEFELNPFALALEDVFLDQWEAGVDLPRRNLEPGSLAPVASPPPGEGDVGSVDEAARQMLANQRLLLPLELPSSDSDRFLALVIAALPRPLRLELRFASWSPSAANRYTLAATWRESALYSSWQPYLMTCVLGALHETCEEYLDNLRRCLREGDLAGLERLGATFRVEAGRTTATTNRPLPRPLTSTINERSAKRIESTKSNPPEANRVTGAERSKPGVGRAAAVRDPQPKPAPRPRRRAVRRRAGGRARRGFATVLSLSIFMAGAYYLWTSGHWTHLPGFTAGGVRLQTRNQYGVVDVAGIYDGALKSLNQGIAGSVGLSEDSRRRHGLEMLQQAGELLGAQGRDYLEQSNQTLGGDSRNGVAPAPADRLRERGRVLARELRRLALARVSLRELQDWQDLSGLDARALEVRLDSLLVSRHGHGPIEPGLVEVDRLLQGVNLKTRQVGGLADLESLLAQDRWDPQWNRRCATAIDDLGGVGQGRARRLRDDAEILVRLKRAEHATDFAARAYRDRYAAATIATPAVDDLLPTVMARGTGPAAVDVPAILTATADLHAGLREACDPATSIERRTELLEALSGSAALEFDAATYQDHVARLRFFVLRDRLRAAPVADDDRPARDARAFADALDADLDATGWRSLAAGLEDPFLIRWATHRAGLREASDRQLRDSFAGDLAQLEQQRAAFLRLAMAGRRCGPAWLDLAERAASVRGRYSDAFPASDPGRVRWRRVDALAGDLANPPELRLAGVTVRLDPSLATAPQDVIVELHAGSAPVRRSPPVRLGPAAPAGSGWVGSCGLEWGVPLAARTPLTIRVLEATGGAELSRVSFEGWLADCDPQQLAGAAADRGVRVSWRLARPYWTDLALTDLVSR